MKEIFLTRNRRKFLQRWKETESEERSRRWKMVRRSLMRSVQVNACWECQVWTRSGREIYKLSFGTSRNSPGWKFTSQLIVISTGRRRVHDYRSAALLTILLSKVERSPDNVCLLSQSDTPERTTFCRERKKGKKRKKRKKEFHRRNDFLGGNSCKCLSRGRSNGSSISMANFRVIWASGAIGTRTSNLTADCLSKERFSGALLRRNRCCT